MESAWIDDVYHTLFGVMAKGFEVEGVENLFQEGMQCDCLYSDMLDAYERLRNRLGVEDYDEDVEIIINALLSISMEMGRHMYRCGAKFQGRE